MSTPPPPPPTPGMTGSPSSPAKKRPAWKNWWFWVIVVLILLLISALAGGGENGIDATSDAPSSDVAAAPTAADGETVEPSEVESTPEETPPPEPEGIGDGSWIVPQDMKPGLYRTSDPGDGCYWERVKNFSGGFNSIIANGNAIGGPIVIEIQKSDGGFNSEGCGTWTTDVSQVSDSRTEVGDGIWIVGTDLAPGTYRATVPGGSCYWARLRSFDGGLNSILANDLPPKGNAIIEIPPDDAGFETHGCGTWKKA